MRTSSVRHTVLLVGSWCVLAALAQAAGCAASNQRPAMCTGTNVMRGADGRCTPCGGAGQPCCPDEDPDSGPPNGDYCTAEGTDCLAPDPETGATGANTCMACGHNGERACASGCVQGFPVAHVEGGPQYCSCQVPEGMTALPGCPAAGAAPSNSGTSAPATSP